MHPFPLGPHCFASTHQRARVETVVMVEVKTYYLPPTDLVPNSPQPLLHYPGLLAHLDDISPADADADAAPAPAARVHDLFARNGWRTQWIYRYGPTQPSHYHARAHEAMAVLSGTATIRFGAADGAGPEHEHEPEPGFGGVEVRARAGDVFVLPAGTAHKTFGAAPEAGGFALLTPGDGHGVVVADNNNTTTTTGDGEGGGGGSDDDDDAAARAVLAGVRLSGFTMLGAYPADGAGWDFVVGGERSRDEYEEVWAVPRPGRDPVLGEAAEGLCGLWK